MIFNKSPENLFNAVFNVPQGATMTLAVGAFLGQTDAVSLIKTFVCAYCAGVMLTLFLRVPDFGAWVQKVFHCENKKVSGYLVSNIAAGALMGILMNFFMTFMAIGPIPEFPAAYFHTLFFSICVSAISSCCWIGPTQWIVGKVCGK